MFQKDANPALALSEKRGREGFPMLNLRSCSSCQHTRRLSFHASAHDHTCPACGHTEKPSEAGLMAQTLSGGKSDLILPILVAILASVVFALFVFSVTLSHISG